MRVETERMYLYPLSDEEMRLVIEKESDPEMKQAYTEMLEGCFSNPTVQNGDIVALELLDNNWKVWIDFLWLEVEYETESNRSKGNNKIRSIWN